MSDENKLEAKQKNADLAVFADMQLFSKFMIEPSASLEDSKTRDSKFKSIPHNNDQKGLSPELARIHNLFRNGVWYLNDRNFQKAFQSFSEAAKEGHMGAACELGGMYHYGRGVEKDWLAASTLYELASRGGNNYATFESTWIRMKQKDENERRYYSTGTRVWWEKLQDLEPFYPYNYNYGLIQLPKSKIDQLSPEKLYEWGMHYFNLEQYDKAVELFSIAYNKKGVSDPGVRAAAQALWRCYRYGLGVPKDLEQAKEHLSLIKPKPAEAEEWGKTYAKQGWYDHAFEMFSCYAGISLDGLYMKGKRHFAKGQKHLGSKDYVEALMWFSVASHQGHKKAPFYLARFYEQGIGCDKDYAVAFRWYKQAYERAEERTDISRTAAALARCFKRGLGVEQNFSSAEYYAEQAERASQQLRSQTTSSAQSSSLASQSTSSSQSVQSVSSALLTYPGTQFAQPPSPPKIQTDTRQILLQNNNDQVAGNQCTRK